ncbi:MarR family winged helix-turn-helix transcriptional regulator [Amycolatopsis sp. cmx-11-12]|uniref:MarR family winged helix-turn-helix transcriptional regulator n=1 Tax=Amycolatopsis sp. cmx-11-12 TaxID=2785795 RepID=UPI00391727F3
MSNESHRTLNLLGAVVTGVHDQLASAVETAAGRSGALAATLAMTAQYEGLTMSTLQRFLGVSRPATIRLVNLLESDGLAVRRNLDDDRRTTSVVLTDAGHREARRVLAARRSVLEHLLPESSKQERVVLDRLLERILTAMITHPSRGYEVCRLCDISTCPPSRCPVETAVVAMEPDAPEGLLHSENERLT